MTPLHWASKMGHLDVVKCLIDNGAVIQLWNNVILTEGKLKLSPIQLAAQNGHQNIVEYLIKNEAYLDVMTKEYRISMDSVI